MTAYSFAVIIGLLVVLVVSEWHHRRVERDLLNRLMSKTYGEYKYYADKWPGDLKAVEAIRKADAPEKTKDGAKETDLSKFEEPWDEEDSP